MSSDADEDRLKTAERKVAKYFLRRACARAEMQSIVFDVYSTRTKTMVRRKYKAAEDKYKYWKNERDRLLDRR